MPEKAPEINKRWLFYIIMFLVPVVGIFLIYFVYTVSRTQIMYNYIKSNSRGWIGQVHRADKELGFMPIPNSSGFEKMPAGSDIPVRYDMEGFRVPADDDAQGSRNNHPVVLALGCSYTYGAATRAEDTFPYLTGKYLGGDTKNAGVCSYGLSQMVIVAKRMIPRYRPAFVVVQYSPWLVDRAILPFAPSYFGKLPNPYYSGENRLMIEPPLFQTKIFELPVDTYQNANRGIGDFFPFLWEVGLPLFIHDDFHMGAYTFASAFGRKEQPTKNGRAVIQQAYEEIYNVSQQNGAALVIVILGVDSRPVPLPRKLLPKDAVIVDAHDALLKRLPNPDRGSYERQYAHWRGNPPRLVDVHPNEKAHKIIAEEIVVKITELQGRDN